MEKYYVMDGSIDISLVVVVYFRLKRKDEKLVAISLRKLAKGVPQTESITYCLFS